MCCLTLASASRSKGWDLFGVCVSTVELDDEWVDLRVWLGDDETVVAEVFAVRGRSAVAWETIAPEVEGILPPSSIRRILVLRSSSSSHTDTAGPVEPCDSVPSAREPVSGNDSPWGVLGSSRDDE